MKKLNYLFILAAVLTFAACGASKKKAAGDSEGLVLYQFSGNEPFWSVRITADAITFETPDEKPVVYPAAQAEKTGGYTIYRSTHKKSNIRVAIADKECTDTMSGDKFPYTVRVEKDGREYTGCGR
jgi:uncharacterized membrane protein